MDISKIISNSIDKAVKDIVNKKPSSHFISDDEITNSLIEENALLMNYSNILITNYHEELKKSLAEQGIKI